MRTVHAEPQITDRRRPAPERLLRQVMVADAVATGVAGIGLLLAADPLADEAGLATTGPVLAVGGFFAVLALLVGAISRVRDPLLVRLAALNGGADVGWAVASVVVGLTADLSGTGRALVLVQAVAVLGVGEAKLLLARRARSSAKIAA